MRVVSWTPNESRIIASVDISTETHNWQFENIDDDSDLEIVAVGESNDNWLCHFEKKITLDWDGTTYVHISDARTFDDSIYCAIRMADNAFRDHQYNSAIIHYQTVLRHYHAIYNTDEWVQAEPFFMYAMERLFIAYILAGDTENAWKTMSLLGQFDHPKYSLAHTFLNANLSELNRFDICQLAFDTITTLISESPAGIYNYRDLPMLGSTDDEFYGRYQQNRQHLGAVGVGCDYVSIMLSQMLNSHFKTTESLKTQLKQLGINIRSILPVDFNQDMQPEYFVWIENYGQGFIFIPQTDEYKVSIVNLWNSTNTGGEIKTLELPENNGIAWFIPYANSFNIGGCSLRQPIAPSDEIGVKSFRLIYLNTLGLEMQEMSICTTFRTDLHNFVLENRLSTVAHSHSTDQGRVYVSRVYKWNAEQERYVEYSARPPVNSNSSATFNNPTLFEVRRLLDSQSYDSVIKLVNTVEILDFEMMYYRAFAYEQLDMIDEAVVDYVHIYTQSPESIWGMMARLHIEPLG